MSDLQIEENDLEIVTALNFCEPAYVAANPDIEAAIKAGTLPSGRAHFESSGRFESNRKQVNSIAEKLGNDLEDVTSSNFIEAAYVAANPDVAAAIEAGTLASGQIHFDTFGSGDHRKQVASIAKKVRDDFETVTDLNFIEAAYVAANADVASAIKAGTLASGRIHFETFKNSGRQRKQVASIAKKVRDDLEIVTPLNFCEVAYVSANPDVATAIENGTLTSGRSHFEFFEKNASRRRQSKSLALQAKVGRRDRIRCLLADIPYVDDGRMFDFLTEELRALFNIIDTENVSSMPYDPDMLALIEKHKDGMVLDCGAGSKPAYFENVVNFEIAAYKSTDVRGVGERLPFKDNVFDAVLSVAVLEHVKDPWACAREIVRVLKPGGDLLCVVPHLQPVHGYPNHYYNMTAQGLANLFGDSVDVTRHHVPDSTLPIWSLSWILQSWATGLEGKAKADFENMRVGDLMGSPLSYLGQDFVKNLSEDKNMELASATVLHAVKPR